VTGFSAERGDQLIVESLPFESALTSLPPASVSTPRKPQTQDPAWPAFFDKNRKLVLLASAGVLIVAVVAVGLMTMRRRKAPARVGVPAGIDTVEVSQGALTQETAVAGQLEAPVTKSPGAEDKELLERVRQIVAQDLIPATAVMREWLREGAK
jgi:flagellar biosynthesis/type III secretory pathway M-ring protein FliF/YscJ